MDSFRQEEILDGDNKWYWGQYKDHGKETKDKGLIHTSSNTYYSANRFLKMIMNVLSLEMHQEKSPILLSVH